MHLVFLSSVLAIMGIRFTDAVETALVWSSERSSSEPSQLHFIDGDPETWIINLKNIGAINVTSRNLVGRQKWQALAVDSRKGLIFGFDSTDRDISYTEYVPGGNSVLTKIHTRCSPRVRALSVDWVSNNLYWVDDAYNWIMVMSIEHKENYAIIVDTGLQDPIAVAVHPKFSYLFWIDRSKKTIERSSLSGEERTVLVSDDLEEPRSLVIDFHRDKLVWLDTYRHTIESCSLSGTNRVTLLYQTVVSSYQSITLYKNILFAAVRNDHQVVIYRLQTDGRLLSSQNNINLQHTNARLFDIKMLSTDVQPDSADPCNNSPCSHICVGKENSQNYQCLCTRGFKLGTDGKLCIEDTALSSPSYVLHIDSSVFQFEPWEPDSDSTSLTPILSRSPGFLAPYHSHGTLWLADTANNSIRVYMPESSTILTKVHLSDTIGGITVDWISGNIYWTEKARGDILVTTAAGRYTTVLITGLKEPSAIALDPYHSCKIFWIETGEFHSIRSSSYDGTTKNYLVRSVIEKPEHLALDVHEQRLYWTDSALGIIASIGLNGSDRKRVFNAEPKDLIYGITVFQDYLCWTSQRKDRGTIQWTLKDDPSHYGIRHHENVGDIISYSQYLQPSLPGSCKDGGGCDQVCLPISKADRKCICSLGYELDGETKCRTEPLTGNFLLVVDSSRFEIYQMDMSDSRRVRALSIPGINPHAVDYDNITGDIYWSDLQVQAIWKANIFISPINPKKILQIPRAVDSSIEGIALDQAGGKLYCTDSKRHTLSSVNTGGGIEQIFFDNLDKPRAIVLDQEERYLFWTDFGYKPAIERVSLEPHLNLKDRKILVVSGIKWPNGLALDTKAKLVYWCDGFNNKVERMNYEGAGRTIIIEEVGSHYFDIAFSEPSLYITDWKSRAVKQLTPNTVGKFLLQSFGPAKFEKASGIKFVGGTSINHTTTTTPATPVEATNWVMIGAIAGGLGALIIIVIIAIVVVVKRRRKPPRPNEMPTDMPNPTGSFTNERSEMVVRNVPRATRKASNVSLPEGEYNQIGTTAFNTPYVAPVNQVGAFQNPQYFIDEGRERKLSERDRMRKLSEDLHTEVAFRGPGGPGLSRTGQRPSQHEGYLQLVESTHGNRPLDYGYLHPTPPVSPAQSMTSPWGPTGDPLYGIAIPHKSAVAGRHE